MPLLLWIFGGLAILGGQNNLYAGFSPARVDPKWHQVDAPLAKVAARPDLGISYRVMKAYSELAEPYWMYRIHFGRLTPKQFEYLHGAYGGLSQVPYREGLEYELQDFLPPAIGALLNRVFYPLDLRFFVPCAAVAYETARRGETLTMFLQGPEFFDGVFDSELFFEKRPKPPRDAVSNEAEPLDLLVIYDAGGITHSATFIDRGVYFEKPAGRHDIPFRFRVSEEKPDGHPYLSSDVAWALRRVRVGSLPNPKSIPYRDGTGPFFEEYPYQLDANGRAVLSADRIDRDAPTPRTSVLATKALTPKTEVGFGRCLWALWRRLFGQ